MGKHLDTELWRETRNASGSTVRVREMLAKGADVNRRHHCGCTPLWEAAYHGRLDLALTLVEAGADVNRVADDGSGPLYWAAQRGHIAVVKLLLSSGANPNGMRDSTLSVLAGAIRPGNLEIVRLLVAAGADVNHRYMDRNMVEYAEWVRQPLIAHYLRQFSGKRRLRRNRDVTS